MARYSQKLSLEEFKTKCDNILKINDKAKGFDPYEFSATIIKDLSKVTFDFENYNIGNADPNYEKYPSDYSGFNGYPCGYHVLENGLPVLFVNAGGDWEIPICFCLYWDGKKMRGYIPTDGNVYNVKEKCAYGSEEDDEENKPEGNPEKIFKDIINRIQIK